jgi:hypothetical protein
MTYRYGQRSEIYYVLVMDEKGKTLSFIPPNEFQNQVIKFIARLPKDLLQIGISLTYYELILRNMLDVPYRFHVKYSPNLAEYLEFVPLNRPFLFFVDVDSKLIDQVIQQLMATHNGLRFYYLLNNHENKTLLPNQIDGPGDFMRKLFEQQESLFGLMGLPFQPLVPAIAPGWEHFYVFPFFVPAQVNYHIANSITGNFDYGSFANHSENLTEAQIVAQTDVSKQAHAEPHRFTRQQEILEQLDKVDYFAVLCRDEEIIRPVHQIEPFFPPLILVAPFQNPDLKDFLSPGKFEQPVKDLIASLQFEQSENYIHIGRISSAQGFLANSQLVGIKTQFLDDIAFLHSSFTFSPVVRLPVQGKTLYRNLSFFHSDVSHRITAPGNNKKLLNTIKTFGELFAKRTISSEFAEKFRDENRQVVAISDLPVEWLDIEGIPLAFTHDICRLPETALHGLMANFVSHEQWQYTVPKDILKKTLVIFGSDEPAFRAWYPAVHSVADKAGVIMRECLTIDALKSAIDEIKPDLLIIDGHGNYDKATKSSVLYIGREKLTGDIIVEKRIMAPLIFLSACNTAPTYGTIDTIANAFFEVGALSVVTTYLPINVHTGSILYIRLLNNLKTASTKAIHQNWLAFIAHLLRTSAVGAAYNAFNAKNPNSTTATSKEQGEDYTYLLSFYERRKIYNKLLQPTGPRLAGTMPEFLFYSVLGRADLIKFQSWADEFVKINA